MSAYKQTKWLVGAVVFCLCSMSAAQGFYYRYINADGVKVISHNVPAEAAKFGYEVVNAQGRVVQVVEPPPPPEDLERVKKERIVIEKYKLLSRRYTSVEELVAARERKLNRLSANIAILKSNIAGLNSQVDDLMSKGADAERAGRKVPHQILTAIKEVRAEIATTQKRLDIRLKEEDQVHQDFADDLILFEKGLALTNRKSTMGKSDTISGTGGLSAP